MLNEDARIIGEDGITYEILDNYERKKAEALLYELKLKQKLLSNFNLKPLNEEKCELWSK